MGHAANGLRHGQALPGQRMIWADDLQSSLGVGAAKLPWCIMRINGDLLRSLALK
jgi:hypothetical protein